jgi:hypothetical protein
MLSKSKIVDKINEKIRTRIDNSLTWKAVEPSDLRQIEITAQQNRTINIA